MKIEYNDTDESFKFSFSAMEQKELINRFSKQSRKVSESEKYKFNGLVHILNEATREHPLGDKVLYVDNDTVNVFTDVVWENTQYNPNDSYWYGLNESLSVAKTSVVKNKLPKFGKIYESVKKEYGYRIKTITELSDAQMKTMEDVLRRFELVDMEMGKRTILQKNPVDFPDIDYAEIYSYDIKTNLPVSAFMLQQELRVALDTPDKFIVVRSMNDPIEIESARLLGMEEMDMEAAEKGLSNAPLLSTDSEYPESSQDGKELYGNEYNSGFLSHLAQITKMGQEEENRPAPLFGWLEVNKELPPVDFNADIKDAPKSVHRFSNFVDSWKDNTTTLGVAVAKGQEKLYRDGKGKLVKKEKK